MTIKASGTLVDITKIKYLRTLVHGEVLRQFEMFSDEVRSTNSEKLRSIILGLGTYFPPVNVL